MIMTVSYTRLYTLFMINEQCFLQDLDVTNRWINQIRINASICEVMRIISLLLVTIITLMCLNSIRFRRIDRPI